jgi:hypothetical protein
MEFQLQAVQLKLKLEQDKRAIAEQSLKDVDKKERVGCLSKFT